MQHHRGVGGSEAGRPSSEDGVGVIWDADFDLTIEEEGSNKPHDLPMDDSTEATCTTDTKSNCRNLDKGALLHVCLPAYSMASNKCFKCWA